ncbi:MAG: ABC transporter permease [Candidatus Eisenbacteria bacterium]|uniref:Transport permease protein n=1 Tax=Eiseniibacteriota bacterium TaxID=2212470 RepID=A0A538T489_UNCEI|nr:MAG: ABC transporter permease [Candidatus Eisenbacteria bacterium]
MRGLLKLTWLEIRIFVREPLGFVSAVGIPLAMFLVLGRSVSPGTDHSARTTQFLAQDLPLFVSIFISINAAISLIAVISIYREGGILKRLRATPLRPAVILGAHVLAKLVFTGIALLVMVLAGRRFYPVALHAHAPGFALAVVVSTVAILCMGFVIASMVGAARFAQLIGGVVFYPMLVVSGMFVPLSSLPQPMALLGRALPMSHAVALLRGAWVGAGWPVLLPDLGALVLTIVICLALTTRVFRWE